MKKSTRTISWVIYIIGVLLLLYGAKLNPDFEIKLTWIALSSILLSVPWIICIIHSIKSKDNQNGLWIYFLFFMGVIFIPLYLIRTRTEK